MRGHQDTGHFHKTGVEMGENSKQGQIHHCKKQENCNNNREVSDRPRGQRIDTLPHSKF